METTLLEDVKKKLMRDQKLRAAEHRVDLLEPELNMLPKNSVIGYLEGQMQLRQDLMDAPTANDRLHVFEKLLQ